MRHVLSAFLLNPVIVSAAAISSPAMATEQSPQAVADELLAVDRRFGSTGPSAASADAVSAMFDDDVVIFAVPVPGFARGRDSARATLSRAFGEAQSHTQWAPIRAGISADGQHGFTFGYMTTTDQNGQTHLAKYLSYWVRRPQGWRVVVFKRVPRPEGEISVEMMAPALPARIRAERGDNSQADRIRETLAQRERSFSDEAQRIGLGPAFAQFGSADAVNVGGGPTFVVGAEAIGAAQGAGPSPLRWAPDGGVIVAASGDLGVTWGLLRRNGPTPAGRMAEIPYFTIWRRSGPNDPWLYVAE